MAKKEAAPAPKERKKTECPLTKEQFMEAAKPVTLTIEQGGSKVQMTLGLKEFSSGSYGWFGNDKLTLVVGETACKIQPSISLVLVGSKPK